MNKTTYYVAVGPGSIVEREGDASYDFEIQATPQEIDQLSQLFEENNETESQDKSAVFTYKTEAANVNYDESLERVYQKLYELGTPATKARIEQMNVLNKPVNRMQTHGTTIH